MSLLVLYQGGGGTPVNATPDTGAATYAGLAPTVQIAVVVNAGVGEATFAGLAPSVQTPRNATPDVGIGEFAGLASTVQAPRNVAAGLGEALYAGLAPTVQTPRNVLAGVGAATWEGMAPTATIAVVVNVGLGEATFAGLAPTIQAPRNVIPGAGVATFVGLAPTAETPMSVLPGVGGLGFVGLAPNAEVPRAVGFGLGKFTRGVFSRAIETPVKVLPAAGDGMFAGFAPAVTAGAGTKAVVFPGAGALSVDGPAPVVAIAISIPPGPFVLSGARHVPPREARAVSGTASLTVAGYAPLVETTTRQRKTAPLPTIVRHVAPARTPDRQKPPASSDRPPGTALPEARYSARPTPRQQPIIACPSPGVLVGGGHAPDVQVWAVPNPWTLEQDEADMLDIISLVAAL